MLVLSRKVDERLLIGPNIEVMVVQIRGDSVRLGITAPEDMIVERPEALERRRRTILHGTADEATEAASEMIKWGRKAEAEELLDLRDGRPPA